jgi:hypothetical protein
MSAIEKTSATCLPPEFYLKLWKVNATKNQAQPKFKSTFIPKKNETKNRK